MKRMFFLGVMVAVMGFAAQAQDFAGQYALQAGGNQITLVFTDTGGGQFEGQLSGGGNAFALSGTVTNGILAGQVGNPQDRVRFEASLQADMLMLVMAEVDAYGQVVPGAVQSLQFYRTASAPMPEAPAVKPGGAVVINGVALRPAQIAEITSTYGIAPLPGAYWYDSKSGLYGVVGYPAYGFMYPGHDFGPLQREASNGNTGVFVNTRELPQLEWAVWSYMLGSYIAPGSYWLDEQGNAGYEGSPHPLVNLYAAAQQNAYQGQGGSGDNFWSSRFSAGNYDAGNQRGYVSVPGHGPIGYGF